MKKISKEDNKVTATPMAVVGRFLLEIGSSELVSCQPPFYHQNEQNLNSKFIMIRKITMTENILISDLFPNRFLRPGDLGDQDNVFTIDRVATENLGHGDRKELKAIVYFKEIEKGFVLNKTNATTISNMYGDQTSRWAGNKIALYVTEVSFQGTSMLGIRVRMRPPSQPHKPNLENPEPTEPPDLWD